MISRYTAFTYRDKAVDAKQTGRELGVGYVLEGSVRRAGHHVRVNAQLIDADTDANLWATPAIYSRCKTRSQAASQSRSISN